MQTSTSSVTSATLEIISIAVATPSYLIGININSLVTSSDVQRAHFRASLFNISWVYYSLQTISSPLVHPLSSQPPCPFTLLPPPPPPLSLPYSPSFSSSPSPKKKESKPEQPNPAVEEKGIGNVETASRNDLLDGLKRKKRITRTYTKKGVLSINLGLDTPPVMQVMVRCK